MQWFAPLLALLSALVQLALAIVRFLEKRDMLEQARAAAGREIDELAKKFKARTDAARSAVDHSPDSVRNDPFNRDQS